MYSGQILPAADTEKKLGMQKFIARDWWGGMQEEGENTCERKRTEAGLKLQSKDCFYRGSLN